MPDDEIARVYREEGFNIAVVGLGYIGSVVAAVFANAGQRVVGLEPRPEVVEAVNRGQCTIFEPGLQEALKRNVEEGRLRATPDPGDAIRNADFVLISVGSPIDDERRVIFSYLDSAAQDVGKSLNRDTMVILKSTVPPLTTEDRVLPVLQRLSGLEAGRDFGLAFVPERTVEGRAMEEMVSLPKIVGGIDPESTRIAGALYAQLGGPVVRVSSPRVAETAKLFDNIYRDTNIALANELALVCEEAGVDYMEASRASNSGSDRTHLLVPGPGVGGSCLTKDPYIFLGSGKRRGEEALLIPRARSVNDSMPRHVLELVQDGFSEVGGKVKGAKIAVMGFAFKGNTDDTRNTPVRELVSLLGEEGARVCIHDPHVKDPGFLGLDEALDGAQCVIVATDHDEYREIPLDELIGKAASPLILVDTRHIFDPAEALLKGIVFRGIGRHPSAFRRH